MVPDSLLLQLLVAWLSPGAGGQVAPAVCLSDVENVRPLVEGVAAVCAWKEGYEACPPECCRERLGLDPGDCPLAAQPGKGRRPGEQEPKLDALGSAQLPGSRAPLQVKTLQPEEQRKPLWEWLQANYRMPLSSFIHLAFILLTDLSCKAPLHMVCRLVVPIGRLKQKT